MLELCLSYNFPHIFICWFALLFWTGAFRSSTNKPPEHHWQRCYCAANEHPVVSQWWMSSSRMGTKPKDSGKGEHTCATGRSMEPSRLFQRSDPCWLDSCPLCIVTSIPSRTKVLHAVTIKDIEGSDVMFYWKIGTQSMLSAHKKLKEMISLKCSLASLQIGPGCSLRLSY